MTELVRYAWWKHPVNALDRPFPVPIRTYSIEPGMGPWVLLHLLDPMDPRDLPKEVVSCAAMTKALDALTG